MAESLEMQSLEMQSLEMQSLEMLDPVDAGRGVRTEHAVAESGSGLSQQVLAVLAFAAAVVIAVTFFGRQETVSDLRSPPLATLIEAPVNTVTGPADVVEAPPVPGDHHPKVSGRPGPNVFLLGQPSHASVVYVNSSGKPTVLDLDSGHVEEVDIAEGRSYDAFLVEFGRVVSDGRSRSLPASGDRAAVFHVYRPFDGLVAPDIVELRRREGASLCLSATPCSPDGWRVQGFTSSLDGVVPLDAERHPRVASIFSPSVWEREDRWLIAPDDIAPDFRIPAPLDDQIWLLTQPPT